MKLQILVINQKENRWTPNTSSISIAFKSPIAQGDQLLLEFEKPLSHEALKQRKNEFFLKCIKALSRFEYSRTILTHEFEELTTDTYLLKIAANRSIKRYRNFRDEKLENWPFCYILINNDPNVQKLAIQHHARVFANTDTVAKIMEFNLNKCLVPLGLHLYIKPTFERNFFWDTVRKHREEVIKVEFELISPNLSTISKSLEVDLGKLYNLTNTQSTRLELNSDKESHLTLDESNSMLNSLVNYASEGGGNISLKIKGIKKKVQTSSSICSTEIDELNIKGPPRQVAAIIKELLDE